MRKKLLLVFFIIFLVGTNEVYAEEKSEDIVVSFTKGNSVIERIKSFIDNILNTKNQTNIITVHYKTDDGKDIKPAKVYSYKQNSHYRIKGDKPIKTD